MSLFSYDKNQKNDLKNFIENEMKKLYLMTKCLKVIFSLKSEEDNDFAEFEGNYKLQNNNEIKIEIKKTSSKI